MDENKELLKKLILTKKNIKRKVMSMKRGVIDAEQTFNETFKPIIEPLNLIVDKTSENQPAQSSKVKEADYLNKTSLYQFTHFFEIPIENRIYDKTYGLYFEKSIQRLQIGEYPVDFIGDTKIVVNDHKYSWTFGLWSLLCEKTPKGATESDKENYFGILSQTNVHLNKNKKPKSNSSFKWKYIVKPIYERLKSYETVNPIKRRKLSNERPHSADAIIQPPPFNFQLESTKKGEGLYKGITDKTQIVYYDDPNELVSRLNLLASSQNAGNTGVDNEMISILEELYERNIIK